MKIQKSANWLGTAALLIALSAPFSALGQQGTSQQEPQTPSTQSPDQNEPQVQTFSGKITKTKGNFVLKDEAGNMAYQLDNADQAKQFVGKKVTVTGTLDTATNMIHVSSIEPASPSY